MPTAHAVSVMESCPRSAVLVVQLMDDAVDAHKNSPTGNGLYF